MDADVETASESIPQLSSADVKARKKKCVKCGIVHPLEEFGKNPSSGDGRKSYCRLCTNNLHRKRHKVDLVARLKHHITTRVKSQLAHVEVPDGYVADIEKYLGYKVWRLKAALDKRVYAEFGISLRTALEQGWHIDHIKPLAAFNPQAIGDTDFQASWAIDNQRAIPADENLRKGSKFDDPGLPGEET